MPSLFKTLADFSCVCRLFRKPSNNPVKIQRHKMIAQAFEKRRDLNNGRMSVSFHSTHDDPLGWCLCLIFVAFSCSCILCCLNVPLWKCASLARRKAGSSKVTLSSRVQPNQIQQSGHILTITHTYITTRHRTGDGLGEGGNFPCKVTNLVLFSLQVGLYLFLECPVLK